MGATATISAGSALDNACEERLEDRFELLNTAGMGFFGIVFYTILKSDFLIEQSNLASDPSKYDSAGGLQKIQAVKTCNPLCPSGIKASASYIVKDIKAMKKVWTYMEENVHYNFVKMLSYSISETPWYSMEPVMSGLTLEKLYLASKAKQQPLSEELAFHMVDQVTNACLFLHKKCCIVHADVNRENFMLRYPGRQTPLMPDVVLIDWSLWEEANPERIVKDTESVYKSLYPVLFEGGWGCGADHEQQGCAIHNITHSAEWFHLYRTISAKQVPLLDLQNMVAGAAKQSRQVTNTDNERANAIKDLLAVAQNPFTEAHLKAVMNDN